jgi:hypothetical protein
MIYALLCILHHRRQQREILSDRELERGRRALTRSSLPLVERAGNLFEGGPVAWPLAVRAQQLLVGFSDDRRFFVPVLVLFVFFVLVIIIGGISGRHHVAAHDADEAPNVLGDPWSHFGSCVDVAKLTDDVSARARDRQSVCIAALHYAGDGGALLRHVRMV